MTQHLTPTPLDRRADDQRRRAQQRRNALLARVELRGAQLEVARFRSGPLGSPDLATTRALYDRLQHGIAADVDSGVTRHRPLSWAVRQVPKVVAAIDGVVLYTFCAVILNVPVGDPLSSPIPALAAAFLAILASGASYIWLALTGSRIRTFRDNLGEVRWRLLGVTAWLMIAVSLVLVGALSLLMYDRILSELLDAGDQGQGALATSLAGAFSVISAVANLSVVAVHALDGSMQSDLHRELGRLLRRRQRRVQRWQRRAVRIVGRLDVQAGQDPAPDVDRES